MCCLVMVNLSSWCCIVVWFLLKFLLFLDGWLGLDMSLCLVIWFCLVLWFWLWIVVVWWIGDKNCRFCWVWVLCICVDDWFCERYCVWVVCFGLDVFVFFSDRIFLIYCWVVLVVEYCVLLFVLMLLYVLDLCCDVGNRWLVWFGYLECEVLWNSL